MRILYGSFLKALSPAVLESQTSVEYQGDTNLLRNQSGVPVETRLPIIELLIHISNCSGNLNKTASKKE